MKTLLLLAALSLPAWAQMSITDLAPSGLLTASGTLACTNDSQSGHLILANTSGKEIVTIEADVVVTCPHTQLKFRYNHDMLPKDHGLMPGDNYDLDLDAGPVNAEGTDASPQFTINVTLLQFADGSIVGSGDERALLSAHRGTLIGLYRSLANADDTGLVNLLRATRNTPPGTVGRGAARFLLDMLDQTDVSSVRAYVKNGLSQITKRQKAWGQ